MLICIIRSNFHLSFTPTEGNCYTYKARKVIIKDSSALQADDVSDIDIDEIRAELETGSDDSGKHAPDETSLAGIDHGLELLLNLEVR